jgi:hypothetical protein
VTPRPWPPPALSVWDHQRSGVRNFLHLQWYHPHPEHGFVADVDIVFAHEGQLAFIANAEHRQASRHCLHRIPILHIDRQIMFSDQQASARVDVKGTRVYFLISMC